MGGLVDTNILIYAVNRSGVFYEKARSFLEELLAQPSPVYLCWPVCYEFLRVTTHPKVFSKPLTWKESSLFLQRLLDSPRIVFLLEGEDHFQVLQGVLKTTTNPSGNLFHDAHIAALAKENGVKVIYTRDGDFRSFPFLDVINPLE